MQLNIKLLPLVLYVPEPEPVSFFFCAIPELTVAPTNMLTHELKGQSHEKKCARL
jgi:hypothetical protein